MQVIFSRTRSRKRLGWTAMSCPVCDFPRPFLCEELLEASSVTMMGLEARGPESRAGEVATCDFCGTTVTGYGEPDLDVGWKPTEGLQVLRDTTNPTLALPAGEVGPTEHALRALLSGAAARRSLLGANASVGMLLGFVIGALLAIPAAAVGAPAGVAFLCGVVFGPFIGGLVQARAQSFRAATAFLSGPMRHYGADPSRLRRLCLEPGSVHRPLLTCVEAAARDLGLDRSSRHRTPPPPSEEP